MGNGPNGVHLVEDGNCYKARKRQTTLPAITEPKKKRGHFDHFDHPYANVTIIFCMFCFQYLKLQKNGAEQLASFS